MAASVGGRCSSTLRRAVGGAVDAAVKSPSAWLLARLGLGTACFFANATAPKEERQGLSECDVVVTVAVCCCTCEWPKDGKLDGKDKDASVTLQLTQISLPGKSSNVPTAGGCAGGGAIALALPHPTATTSTANNNRGICFVIIIIVVWTMTPN